MSELFINEESFLSMPAIRFAAGGYEALIVPEMGANVVMLKNKLKNVDILRTPTEENREEFLTRPQVYGIPVLFMPNRIANGTFSLEGKTYNFPITDTVFNNHVHGFLHKRPWNITKKTIIDDKAIIEATFICDENTDFYKYFPHDFTFTLRYTLCSEGLLQEINIKNNSTEKMPVGLGFHTAIKVPFNEKSNGDNYVVRASADKKWELENMLPTGNYLIELTEFDKKFTKDGQKAINQVLDGLSFTSSKMDLNGININGAVITDNDNNISVVYEWGDKFKHSVIWNSNGDKNFVCPEPQTWAINAPNIPLPHHITGVVTISPQESWSDYTKLYVK